MSSFFSKLLGASWKTSLFGFIAVASAFVTNEPQLVSAVLDPSTAKHVFAIASLISGFIAFKYAKDKNVIGGDTQATISGDVAKPGTQTLVDATVKASVASDDMTVTHEQKAKANS